MSDEERKKEQLKYKPDPVEKANGELVWDVPYGNGGSFLVSKIMLCYFASYWKYGTN